MYDYLHKKSGKNPKEYFNYAVYLSSQYKNALKLSDYDRVEMIQMCTLPQLHEKCNEETGY